MKKMTTPKQILLFAHYDTIYFIHWMSTTIILAPKGDLVKYRPTFFNKRIRQVRVKRDDSLKCPSGYGLQLEKTCQVVLFKPFCHRRDSEGSRNCNVYYEWHNLCK